MLLVIPLLKFENGKNLFVIKGNEGSKPYYNELSNNPVEFCKLIRSENFKTIHVDIVDSIENNFDILKHITQLLDIPIQVNANFDSISQCKQLLESGIYRIILDDFILRQKDEVRQLIREFTPSRIVASVHIDNMNVRLKSKSYILNDYIKSLKQIGIQRIVLSSDSWEINPIISLKDILIDAKIRTTIYDAVNSPEQLWELGDMINYGIDSVIIGDAIYQNKFPCQNMWRDIELD